MANRPLQSGNDVASSPSLRIWPSRRLLVPPLHSSSTRLPARWRLVSSPVARPPNAAVYVPAPAFAAVLPLRGSGSSGTAKPPAREGFAVFSFRERRRLVFAGQRYVPVQCRHPKATEWRRERRRGLNTRIVTSRDVTNLTVRSERDFNLNILYSLNRFFTISIWLLSQYYYA